MYTQDWDWELAAVMRIKPTEHRPWSPRFHKHLHDIHLSCVYISRAFLGKLCSSYEFLGTQASRLCQLPPSCSIFSLKGRASRLPLPTGFLYTLILILLFFRNLTVAPVTTSHPELWSQKSFFLWLEQKFNNQYSIITFMLMKVTVPAWKESQGSLPRLFVG